MWWLLHPRSLNYCLNAYRYMLASSIASSPNLSFKRVPASSNGVAIYDNNILDRSVYNCRGSQRRHNVVGNVASPPGE